MSYFYGSLWGHGGTATRCGAKTSGIEVDVLNIDTGGYPHSGHRPLKIFINGRELMSIGENRYIFVGENAPVV